MHYEKSLNSCIPYVYKGLLSMDKVYTIYIHIYM